MSNIDPLLTQTPPLARRALITGGVRRIGGAITQALAAAGWSVIIHARTPSYQEASEFATLLRARGADAHVVTADFMDEEATDALIPNINKTIGPITLLVNNASLFLPDTAERFESTSYAAHMAVNLRAPTQLSAAFVAQLPEDIQGNIIHILDQRILYPSSDYFSYTLSKSALWVATRTMAQTYAPRARVNAIGPGPTFANSNEGEIGLLQEIANLPLKTQIAASQIAETILYLVGASHVTGQMIAVDGGQHLVSK